MVIIHLLIMSHGAFGQSAICVIMLIFWWHLILEEIRWCLVSVQLRNCWILSLTFSFIREFCGTVCFVCAVKQLLLLNWDILYCNRSVMIITIGYKAFLQWRRQKFFSGGAKSLSPLWFNTSNVSLFTLHKNSGGAAAKKGGLEPLSPTAGTATAFLHFSVHCTLVCSGLCNKLVYKLPEVLEEIWKWGHKSPVQSGKFFLHYPPPHTFQ